MDKNQPTPMTARQKGPAAKPAAQPEAAATGEQKAEPRKVRQLEASRFAGLEFTRASWLCTAHENTTPQDLLEPSYWAHVAAMLTPRSRIEAWANDGTWLAEFVVLEAGRNWARVHMLCVHHLTTADVAQTLADGMSPYEITHRGPHAQWSVIRKSDRQVLTEGHPTARAASEWADERLKADR